jgi:hypothetical protein
MSMFKLLFAKMNECGVQYLCGKCNKKIVSLRWARYRQERRSVVMNTPFSDPIIITDIVNNFYDIKKYLTPVVVTSELCGDCRVTLTKQCKICNHKGDKDLCDGCSYSIQSYTPAEEEYTSDNRICDSCGYMEVVCACMGMRTYDEHRDDILLD